jgi:hypothetical protein
VITILLLEDLQAQEGTSLFDAEFKFIWQLQFILVALRQNVKTVVGHLQKMKPPPPDPNSTQEELEKLKAHFTDRAETAFFPEEKTHDEELAMLVQARLIRSSDTSTAGA